MMIKQSKNVFEIIGLIRYLCRAWLQQLKYKIVDKFGLNGKHGDYRDWR